MQKKIFEDSDTVKNHLIKIAALFLLTISSSACSGRTDVKATTVSAVDRLESIKVNEVHYRWHQQASGGVFTPHPSVLRYVAKVGKRIARVSQFPKLPYEFIVVNHPAPHALALLSGKIAINRGLLVELENEAELAAVLAQNIALSPILYRSRGNKDFSFFNQPLTSLRSNYLKHFTYKQLPLRMELEIDRLALKYLIRAGYDPKALLSVHIKLMRLKEQTNSHQGLSIHPFSCKRIAETSLFLRTYNEGGYLGLAPYKEAMRPVFESQSAYRLHERGMVCLLEGDHQSALETANAAINIEPLEPNFHILKGKAYSQIENLKDANRAFNRAIQLEPNYYRPYLERGRIYYKNSCFNDARDDFEKCIELFPSPQAYYMLGKTYNQLGNAAKANELLLQIVDSDQTFAQEARELLSEIAELQ